MAFAQIINNKIIAIYPYLPKDINCIEEIKDNDPRIIEFLDQPPIIIDKIIALESSITPRRLQGALGGNKSDIKFMTNLEKQKNKLRAKLNKKK